MIASPPSLQAPSSARKIDRHDEGSVTERLRMALYMIAMLSTPFLFWAGVACLIWLLA